MDLLIPFQLHLGKKEFLVCTASIPNNYYVCLEYHPLKTLIENENQDESLSLLGNACFYHCCSLLPWRTLTAVAFGALPVLPCPTPRASLTLLLTWSFLAHLDSNMCLLKGLLGQVQELLAAQREVEGQGFDIWGLWEGRDRKINISQK